MTLIKLRIILLYIRISSWYFSWKMRRTIKRLVKEIDRYPESRYTYLEGMKPINLPLESLESVFKKEDEDNGA